MLTQDPEAEAVQQCKSINASYFHGNADATDHPGNSCIYTS